MKLTVEVEGTTVRKEMELQIGSSIEDVEAILVSTLYVEKIVDQEYNGKPVTPSVEVIDNGVTLKEGMDYTLTYADNDKAGTATVTIEGIGNYTGSRTETFTIIEVKNPELATPTISSIQNTM